MNDVKGREWSSDLPQDAFRLILSNLISTYDLKQFGVVCKKWHLAMMDYIKNYVFGRQWLVKKRIMESGITLYHPLKDYRCYIDNIPHIRGASILCSKDGWLLMNRGRKVFLLNPLSKSMIKLPELPLNGHSFTCFTITSAPTSKDWQVCGLKLYQRLGIFTICHGGKDWTRTAFTFPQGHFNPEETNLVYHMGKFYFLCVRGTILGVVDPKNRSCTLLKTTKGLGTISTGSTPHYLLECEGDLFVVFNSFKGSSVSVRKLDESKMIWNEIKDIGEYAFFLNHKTSYAKRSTSNFMRNKLFFPNLHEEYGVFYCLEKGSYGTFGDEFSITNLMNTIFILECCWMEASQHDHSSTEECLQAISDDEDDYTEDDDDDTRAE